MDNKIICVRIAQRVLQHKGASKYDRFPFDRVYLGKKHLAPQFKRMFRYHMLMDLDKPLLDALNILSVSTVRKTPVVRENTQCTEGKVKSQQNAFVPYIRNTLDWLLVVPTHIKTTYKKTGNVIEPYEPVKSELGYILSNAVKLTKNEGIRLPPITLVTPKRTIPILCGVCRHILDLHSGKCIPGQFTCKERAKISLRADNHMRDTTAQSVKESGGY